MTNEKLANYLERYFGRRPTPQELTEIAAMCHSQKTENQRRFYNVKLSFRAKKYLNGADTEEGQCSSVVWCSGTEEQLNSNEYVFGIVKSQCEQSICEMWKYAACNVVIKNLELFKTEQI